MEPRRLARSHRPRHGGVPTPRARRARLATALGALALAAALAAETAARAGSGTETVALVGGLGFALALAGLARPWEDGVVAGAVLLFVGYTLSLALAHRPLDRSAPLVSAGLLAVVELGSWSLELRDGAEERPLSRLRTVLLTLAVGAAVSALVWSAGTVHARGGIALLVVGAAAALGLLVLLTGWARADAELD